MLKKTLIILLFFGLLTPAIAISAFFLVQNFSKTNSAVANGMQIWKKNTESTINTNLVATTTTSNQYETKPDTKISGGNIIMENYGSEAPNPNITWYKPNTYQEWRYRKCFNINNTSNQNTAGLFANLILDSATLVSQNKSLSSGADIRIVDSNNQVLSFGFASWNSTDTMIKVRLNMTPNENRTVCMYYGYIPYFDNGTLPTAVNNP